MNKDNFQVARLEKTLLQHNTCFAFLVDAWIYRAFPHFSEKIKHDMFSVHVLNHEYLILY